MVVSLNNSELSQKITSQIEHVSTTNLKNNADWTLGSVTGNNKKYVSGRKNKNSEPVILGSKISRFRIEDGRDFLLKDYKRFQQMSALENYRQNPKLVYRFICKDLVFAIDRKGLLALNSANSVVPRLEGYSVELLCGLFNSKLAQYYFHKKHNTFKVLRSHIENFPLPPLNAALIAKIESLVLELEKKTTPETLSQLDRLVLKAYDLGGDFNREIENYE